MPIPEGRNAAGFAIPGKYLFGGSDDFCGIGTDELVCAFGDGDGALGVLAEREAGDAQGTILELFSASSWQLCH